MPPILREALEEVVRGGVAFAQNQRDEVRYVSGDGEVAGCVAATHRSDCKNETLLCVASNAANAEICQDVSPVLLARQYKDPPYIVDSSRDDIVCVVDDNANSAIDMNLAGTLKIGGGGRS